MRRRNVWAGVSERATLRRTLQGNSPRGTRADRAFGSVGGLAAMPLTAADLETIRDECLADDVEIPAEAVAWIEEEAVAFFESGGTELPRDNRVDLSKRGPSHVWATRDDRRKTYRPSTSSTRFKH